MNWVERNYKMIMLVAMGLELLMLAWIAFKA